jgi:hypothetical protein
MGASMRFIVSCLLLTFLTACQTVQRPPSNVLAAVNLPSEKWASAHVSANGEQRTFFVCPETKCGETVVVLVFKGTVPTNSNVSAEEILRLRSVDDALLKDGLALIIAKATLDSDKRFELQTVRKINGDPVGVYIEGTAIDGTKSLAFSADSRLKGNQVVGVAAYAPSAKIARSSLKQVNLTALLH